MLEYTDKAVINIKCVVIDGHIESLLALRDKHEPGSDSWMNFQSSIDDMINQKKELRKTLIAG